MLFCFVFITCFYTAGAQSTYNFHNLFLNNGLSDARVNCIVQDRFGFMWFGTQNGLNRYDGYSMRKYVGGREQGQLPSNEILSLFSSKDGSLWIGTARGLTRYDFATEKFIAIDSVDRSSGQLASMPVYAMQEDEAGRFYVGGKDGLFRRSTAAGNWQDLGLAMGVPQRLKQVRKLKFFSPSVLFVTTNTNLPFFQLDLSSNKADSVLYKTEFGEGWNYNMFGLEKLNDSEMMTGFLSQGVAILDVKTKQYRTVKGVLGHTDSILYNTVYDVLRDKNGRVWIASAYHRLLEYLPALDTVIAVPRDPYNPLGFDGNSASCIYEDRQHNIWVGTRANGLYRFNPAFDAVKFYPQHDFIKGQLATGRVTSISMAGPDKVLVGTDRGPSIYDRRTKLFTNYRGVSVNGIDGPVEMIQSSYTDSAGIIWLGSNRLGLVRYDAAANSWRNFSRVTESFPLLNDGISDIVPLPGGRLLFIGFGRPNIFNTKTFITSSAATDSSSKLLGLLNIQELVLDDKKHCWLADDAGGLFEYDPFTGQLTDMKQWLPPATNPLRITGLSWQGNTLVIACNLGIVITGAAVKPRIIEVRGPGNVVLDVKGVLADGNYIWFCSNRVPGRLHIKTGSIELLGERDGLAGVQLFYQTLTRSSTGSILIGANKGLFEIFPDKLRKQTGMGVYLTDFRVYDKRFLSADMISSASSINLKSDQNFFSFDMSSFDYAGAGDVEYSYKLEGFENEWQQAGGKRTGTYTNVPGGDYTLKMRVRDSSGGWTESPQRLAIHIAKPLYQQWWFRILAFLMIGAVVVYLYRARIARINREAMLRSDYEIKLNELENSALRTQMNPHFIFNSLNTINSFINSNDAVQANKYISKFSRLVRLILDHSRQKKILLKDELEVAGLYIQLEQIRFNNKFNYELDVSGIDTSELEVPPLIIQPFVENAILHGLLPSPGEGLLRISIREVNDSLVCIVEDNGIGREAANQIRQERGYQHKSHGMEITLKRIALFNREHDRDQAVVFEDIMDKDKVSGTRVIITLARIETF